MNILKAEMKQMVTHEIGVRVDDALEAARKELAVLEGRQTAFLDGAKAVEALMKAVDADCDSEKYGLEVGAEIKRYLSRGSQALQNLSIQANNMRIAQAGKVQGFEHTIRLLQNLIEQEKQKVEQAKAKAEEEGVDVEEVPRRMTLKERRQAEEQAEEQAEQAASPAAETPSAETSAPPTGASNAAEAATLNTDEKDEKPGRKVRKSRAPDS
jgi:hypothetical protein